MCGKVFDCFLLRQLDSSDLRFCCWTYLYALVRIYGTRCLLCSCCPILSAPAQAARRQTLIRRIVCSHCLSYTAGHFAQYARFCYTLHRFSQAGTPRARCVCGVIVIPICDRTPAARPSRHVVGTSLSTQRSRVNESAVCSFDRCPLWRIHIKVIDTARPIAVAHGSRLIHKTTRTRHTESHRFRCLWPAICARAAVHCDYLGSVASRRRGASPVGY